MAPSPPPLPVPLTVITLLPLVVPLSFCWLLRFPVPQPLPLVAPPPGALPPPFITPPPFVAPLLFTWLSLCLAPWPRPLVATPPGAASCHTPLIRLFCPIAQRLGLSYGWLSCCLSSLPSVHLCLSFVRAFGIVSRCYCRHIHPIRHLLSQNRSGASPNIAISFVIMARVRCQRASHAIAVVVCALAHVRRQRKASPNVAVIARARRQGLAPRGERAQMDDEQCPETTIGVGPKSQLCEPVVTRLTQN